MEEQEGKSLKRQGKGAECVRAYRCREYKERRSQVKIKKRSIRESERVLFKGGKKVGGENNILCDALCVCVNRWWGCDTVVKNERTLVLDEIENTTLC